MTVSQALIWYGRVRCGPHRTAVGGLHEPDLQLAGRAAGAVGVEVVGEAEAPGRARVDRDARDEVVDRARGRVDRHPCDCRPGKAVGRGAHDDVVAGAALAEPAVLPDDVHLAGSVDLGRGQRAGPQVPGL